MAVALALVLRGEPQARATGERAERLANRALRLARRHPRAGWGEAVVQFRRETIDLLARRWAAITVAAFAGHLAVFGVLIVSLRATGVDAGQVSWVEALAAWGLVRLLTAVPVTPGGVGIVELGLSSALVGFGADNAEAVRGRPALPGAHRHPDACARRHPRPHVAQAPRRAVGRMSTRPHCSGAGVSVPSRPVAQGVCDG